MNDFFLKTFAEIRNCAGGDAANRNECNTNLPNIAANSDSLTAALTIVFGVITAVSVIIIIVQAIKFTLSSGEPEKAANARKGIIYAVVGLAISLSANFIILFVLQDVFS